ncbi:indolepyruvate oxidoreductase subunit beta [Dehalogenimonas alkenigignens]|uniref:Pyruvate:ferredoxin oxidoreductase or related 2-oxoacid:ferredoxin oxidoreductase, gamma subunit n=1 Tax=Dehalogenimonas alkenigignens TaxID=1217799 RepID=A0A0W0GHY3_9CHLR|nr:indolepyruvate oxidoreductase subunit beta [Dehalogenimonas alkenigignens]KTB48149.1 Pyruvate:ferredoxin oxidoreductase or related 2-oxoacid:ferredoxin oxidoreductase, gamma subunit [Dehalogenimonas alkenigignens]PVV84388.1 indolepyruvate oxidoreductase subunit beta [Dehalogenimonas alkenigignens]
MKTQNILIVGVGGQGVVLASNLLAEAALAAGYDVKKTDTLGMAQRGGSVVSHLRFGEQVASPLIPAGGADVLIAFEKLEAIRWGHFLKTDGAAVVNDLAMPPLSVTLGSDVYPCDAEIVAALERFTPEVHLVPGTAAASRLGNAKMVNTVLLGYASKFLPIEAEKLASTIEAGLPPKLRQPNLVAFETGRSMYLR